METIKHFTITTILVCLCMFALTSCQRSTPNKVNATYDAASGYTIITDTISIKAQNYIPAIRAMRLIKACRYRDGYMCHFSYNNYTLKITELGLGEGIVLLFISKDGKNIVKMPMPDDYETKHNFYSFIKVISDTLYFINNKTKSVNYWTEEAQKWHNTDNIPPYPPTDDEFSVCSINHGEWGTFAQFHEKSTGADYLFTSEMLNTFKYKKAYYIVEPFHICKVSDPHSGWMKNDSIHYTKWEAPQAGIVINTKYHNYIDHEWSDDHSQDTIFCDQFLRHGQLYFLIRGSEETYIAKYKKAEHSSFEKILSLGNIPIWTAKREQFDTIPELIDFEQDWQTEGLLDIADDTIRLTYLNKEYDTLRYTGTEAVAEIINYLQNNLGTATIDSVRAFEHNIGGQFEDLVFETDSQGYTTNAFIQKIMKLKNRDYPKDEDSGYERINCFNLLDGHSTFWIAYCYNKQTRILTSAFAEISETRHLNGTKSENRIQNKQMDSIITRCLSVAPVAEGEWIKNNIHYKLNNQHIYLRLSIQRQQ